MAEDFSTLAVIRGIGLKGKEFLNSNSKQLVKGMYKRFHLERFQAHFLTCCFENTTMGGGEHINLHWIEEQKEGYISIQADKELVRTKHMIQVLSNTKLVILIG